MTIANQSLMDKALKRTKVEILNAYFQKLNSNVIILERIKLYESKKKSAEPTSTYQLKLK